MGERPARPQYSNVPLFQYSMLSPADLDFKSVTPKDLGDFAHCIIARGLALHQIDPTCQTDSLLYTAAIVGQDIDPAHGLQRLHERGRTLDVGPVVVRSNELPDLLGEN